MSIGSLKFRICLNCGNVQCDFILLILRMFEKIFLSGLAQSKIVLLFCVP